MRYNCDDIHRILNNDDESSVNIWLFENHLENCPDCGQLCDLGYDIEESLTFTLPRNVPADFSARVAEKIKGFEGESWKIKCLEGVIPFAVTASVLLFSTLLIGKWNVVKGIISKFDADIIKTEIAGLLKYLKMPEIDFSGIDSYLSGSPLVLFALVSIAAIVWVFSLIEFEKNIE